MILVLLAAALASPAAASAASVRAYSLGNQTVQVAEWNGSLHAVNVQMKGLIAVPAGTRAAGVVVIEHGSYGTCRNAAGDVVKNVAYPCPAGLTELDNAGGHLALVAALADAGFIALSINANAAFPLDEGARYGDGFDSSTTGAFDMRAQLITLHLAALATASAGGANSFGVPLAARADMSRVGLVGHSRGGEGVVEEVRRSHPGFTVRGVFLISPTNFTPRTLPDVPLHIVLASCDGDVWNLAGAAYYDRARLGTRVAPISQTLLMGANHNWFSSTWSPGPPWGFDDAPANPGCERRLVGSSRPTAGRQQVVVGSLAAAFFRRNLVGGAPSSLIGDRALPRTIAGVPVVASYDAPSAKRVDIDRPAQRARSAFGTRVRSAGLSLGYRVVSTPNISRQPPGNWSPHRLALRTIRWTHRGGRVVIPLPKPDIRAQNTLSMRLAVNTWSNRSTARVDLYLRDRAGHHRTVRVTVARQRPDTGAYRKAVLGTVRVSLRRFRGVDLKRLSVLELRPVGSRGALLLADLAFVRLP